MKRRQNGEGSFSKKTVKGHTYYIYRAPNDAWSVTGKTMKEVKAKKEEREKVVQVKTWTTAPMTVSELCESWLKEVHNTVSPNTFDAYEDIVKVRIRQYTAYDIGNKQVLGLTVCILDSYLNSLSAKYSKASIDKTWVVLKQSLLYGQSNGYVPTSLDLKQVKKPNEHKVAVKKKEVQFATLEDIEILYEEAYRSNDDDVLIYGNGAKVLVFIMYSGVRIGEAIGLTWRYIREDYSEVHIQHSNRRIVKRDENGDPVMEGDHKVYEDFQKSTKTESGDRIIPLPERGIEVLRYFDEAFPDHKPDDHVFLTKNGRLFDRRNLEHLLTRMMNNSECSNKEYTPHSLRHGYGSILLSQGVDIKTVSLLLGHKDISTTYNIYIHVLPEDKKKAVTDVFNKKKASR